MSDASVVILGRPNVGKSTLFNRLIGRNRALVFDRPGVTRDHLESHWKLPNGGQVNLVDTSGLDDASIEPELRAELWAKTERLIQNACAVLFLVNGRAGLMGEDQSWVKTLRKLGQDKILLVINHADPGSKVDAHEFAKMGLEGMIKISAEHKLGLEQISDFVESQLKGMEEAPTASSLHQIGIPRICVLGRPNVGKSSIINALLGEDRLLVHDAMGTTHDSVDVEVEKLGKKLIIVDTPGVRKKRRIDDLLERDFVAQSFKSVRRSDLVWLVLDIGDLLTSQELKLAKRVVDAGKGLILVINKWDQVPDSERIRHEVREDVYAEAPFLKFAEIRFVSAHSGQGLQGLIKTTHRLGELMARGYDKQFLSDLFDEIRQAHREVGERGFRLRIDGLKQDPVEKTKFFIYCNDTKFASESYRKFWENQLRERLKLRGVPIQLKFIRRRPKG